MINSNNQHPSTCHHQHSQHRQSQHFNRHRNFRNHQNQSLFVVRLFSNHRNNNRTQSPIETLISQCNPKPDKSYTNPTSAVAASLFFHDQNDAIVASVFLWERRLAGDHVYTPVTDFDVNEGDLNERIRGLFKLYAEKVLEGEVVKKLERKIENLAVEIGKFTSFLKRPKGVRVYSENKVKKEALRVEMEVVVKRVEEFRKGMRCLMDCIEGKEIGDLGVLRVHDEGNGRKMGIFYYWSRIHFLILRECRRVENGLPIYGFRSEFLKMLHSQQVMVLIGETGSGKSTQLAQFIADSGVASSGSILCTQPRKIAAISLGKRVGEECNGCYEDNSIICYPSYSSSQQFGSKVIYMTDHCLLQNLMKDKNLFGVSCIIVDEAHERSLNTDLLLGLLKELLQERPDLQLIIMSATVDASKLSSYFFGCGTFHVLGRSFPVEIKYAPAASRESLDPLPSSNNAAPYVCDVVKMATEIHAAEEDGAILAFLTSQAEVEWACEKFQSPSAIALPLHGKLFHEEQCRVFQNYPGKRKVVFATNLAETSITIPGVKYVVDSGLVKDSRFESSSGMNVLRVSKISQSSANQRAGRAGRTDPGKCYRLYSVSDYQSMDLHQEPEICKVHLGIAVLRILASGIKNVLEFDFIDAPSVDAINKAIRNLVQLGAVACKHDAFELTADGHYLVKLGMEPRLGKIILESLRYGLLKEGVVLAAAMANASNIFCRVGTYDEKLKSDCLKVRFCHHDGDLFTLLSVYREWESMRQENRNKWCWENRINAKTMRRCRDTVLELENCLKNELNIIIPTYWLWDPLVASVHDENMKKIILSSLADNVAMYSGYDRLGYEVVLSGEYFQLHPSCSLQVYNQKPHWVVFAELLSISSQYLVCVTAIDFDSLSTFIHPLFDVSKMESRKLQLRVIKGFGGVALKRFCGKSNSSLIALVSRMRAIYISFNSTTAAAKHLEHPQYRKKMGSGRRRSGGGGGGSGGGRNQRLLKHHIDTCNKKFTTTDDIVHHLRNSYPNYRRMELKTLTRIVQQTLNQQTPPPKKFRKHELETESDSDDEEANLSTTVSKKQKRIDESEEKLMQIENAYSRRRSRNRGPILVSSSDTESSSESDSDSSTSLEPPKFDLMKSMLRESYGVAEKNMEVELANDRKESITSKVDMIERNRGVGKQKGEDLEGSLGKLKGGLGEDAKGKEGGPRFKDLGGLSGILEELEMEVFLPLYHPNVPLRLGVSPISGILLHGPPGCGKTKLAHAIANETGVPFYKISATEVVSGVSGASEENIRDLFSKAYRTAPSIIFIDEIDAIASKRENLQREMERRIVTQLMTCMDEHHRLGQPSDDSSSSESSNRIPGNVLVIGATNRPDAVDPALRRPGRFDREINLGVPDEKARVQILSVLTKNCTLEGSLDILQIARSTPGFVGADLNALVNTAGNLAMRRVASQRKSELSGQLTEKEDNEDWWKQPWSPEEMEKLAITMSDFENAAKLVQPSSKREGFSTIPNVKWEDVGGLDDIRDEFDLYIISRIKYPDDYQKFGVNLETGILLYGPPGCGKTMIAKAAANEAGANFIHVKGPELLNKYVGESELAVRTLFSRARTCSPCIIFFDEVDALTTMRGKEGGWVVERLLNQLLIELDGADQRPGIFIIGATNRPEVMDPAVLRPGRFGKLLYVPLPSSEDRGLILKALAKGKPIDPSVDLAAIGQMEACKNFSGADLRKLMEEAAMTALKEAKRQRCLNETSGTITATQNEPAVNITATHFEQALGKISPSVSEKQIQYYKAWSESFKAT